MFEPGEIVRVTDGPFNDFNGVVEEVNYEKSRLQVAVNYFWSLNSCGVGFWSSRKGLIRRLHVEQSIKIVRNKRGVTDFKLEAARLNPQGAKMAKKVDAYIKLQVAAGQANPSPPVGPALGQHGVNIMDFCKAFNAQTQSVEQGLPIPVVITVYADKSFTFVTKTPPAAVLLRKAANIAKGSATPNTHKVAKVNREQLEEIAKIKMPDLNRSGYGCGGSNDCRHRACFWH